MTTTTKPYKGPAMEGAIASWYSRITRTDRGYTTLAQTIAARLPVGARVLEVAPGPGYLAIELARRGLRVTAIDISHSFVRIAGDHARAAGVELDVRHGNASQLPCPDDAFDFVVCRAAFKNFGDPLGALDEIFRVLAPGGRASIIDLRREASRDEVRAEVDAMQLGWLNTLDPRHLPLVPAEEGLLAIRDRAARGGEPLRPRRPPPRRHRLRPAARKAARPVAGVI